MSGLLGLKKFWCLQGTNLLEIAFLGVVGFIKHSICKSLTLKKVIGKKAICVFVVDLRVTVGS